MGNRIRIRRRNFRISLMPRIRKMPSSRREPKTGRSNTMDARRNGKRPRPRERKPRRKKTGKPRTKSGRRPRKSLKISREDDAKWKMYDEKYKDQAKEVKTRLDKWNT